LNEQVTKLALMPPQFRASTSKDLERGKPLELGWLSGRVHALGQSLRVATPAHSTVYRALVLYRDGLAQRLAANAAGAVGASRPGS